MVPIWFTLWFIMYTNFVELALCLNLRLASKLDCL